MNLLQHTHRLLDETLAALHADDVAGPVTRLVDGLQDLKDSATPEEWARLSEACVRHPLRAKLHEDPLTARAFFKPRSYAGDAGIIDLIYQHPWTAPLIEGATPLGQRLYTFLSTEGPIPRAIRERRRIAAEAIDATADRVPGARVMSVACGHLREAELSSAVRERRLGRLVALDQDGESLEEVRRCYGALGVECVREEVEAFLDDAARVRGEFDLIYSTGLYDYLDDAVGAALTAKLFDRLRPGGSVLVANLLRDGREVAYTESIMDWHVIYRDDDELRALAARIPPARIGSIELIGEPNRRVAFVRVTRADGGK